MLVLFLLNATSTIATEIGVGDSLTTSRNRVFSPSNGISSLETTMDLSGILGMSNWYTSDVTVTFLVDGVNPEFTTAYSFDSVNWIPYVGSFVVATEGITTIYYNSTDSVGSIEETKVSSIQIDKTPPRLTLETESIPGDGVLVTIVAIEDVSYLVDIGYSLDGGRWLRYPGPFLLTEEGVHPVYYRATDIAGNTVSLLDYVEVIMAPAITSTEVSYMGDTAGVYSDPVTLEAVLFDMLTGVPIPDKLIVFTVGTQSVSAMTDSDGIAVTTLVLDQPAGIYDVTASFEGDEDYLASSVTQEFALAKEQALTHYSGLTIIEDGDSINLMATVFDEADGYPGDLTKIYVTFTLYLTTDPSVPIHVVGPIMVEPTDIAGIGVATAAISALPTGDYLVVVSLNPEHNHHYFSPDSEAVTLTVYEPTRGKTIGFGWTRDSDGNKGFFTFYVKYSHRGNLRGFVYFRLRVDNMVYYLKTTEITGFSIDGKHAFFEATCTIYQYNTETRERTQLDDRYRLRIDVWDIKRRCGDDIFQIRIYDGNGLVVYEVGFDPQDELIWGKIMVNTCRRRRWY